jgi:hypothetical protein
MSSADRDDARLPARVEALLSEWPLPEKDDQHWEARAQAIQARLLEPQPKASADLLRAPFPSSPGDEGPDAQRASPKLSDIARAVRESKPDYNPSELARTPRDSKPDQQLTEIARASLSLASQGRAAAPEVAARVRAAQAAQAPAVATPVPERPSARAPAPPPAEAITGSRRGPLIALIGGGLALAAAVALVMRTKDEAPPSQAQAPAAAPLASAAPAPPAAMPEPGVNVDDLAAAPESKAARAPRPVAKPGVAPRPEQPVAELPQPAPAPPAAAAAKPQASSASEPELKPADGRNAGLPEKPSTGAVQAALGSVIGGARSCVSGQNRPSSATIVFGSDGRVQSVAVGGAAADTPAAACIRSALQKARVHPFAKPTFSASVTIRPN